MLAFIYAFILTLAYPSMDQVNKSVQYTVRDAFYSRGAVLVEVGLANATGTSQTVRVAYHRILTKRGVQRVYDDGQRITLLPGQSEIIFILLDHPDKVRRVQLSFLIIGKNGRSGYEWVNVK